jgi:Single-strand binding protein family
MITVTITGNLTDDPRSFSTRDGQSGCELRVAVDLPPRGGSGEGLTRYFKVVTFGVMAEHAATSVRMGDRVTVQGYDLTSEVWVSDAGEPRGGLGGAGDRIPQPHRPVGARSGEALPVGAERHRVQCGGWRSTRRSRCTSRRRRGRG